MSNDGQDNSIKGHIIAGIITIVSTLIIGGTAPWWWQEVKPNSSKPEPEEPKPTQPQPEVKSEPTPSQPPVTPVTPPTPQPPVPQIARVPINIAYTGDYYACNLPVSIAIGDQQFSPQGNLFQANVFQANGIQTGQQN